MNLMDDETFLTSLLKRAKSIFNQIIIFLRDTEGRICINEINNGWNTNNVHIFHEELYGKFLFKVNLLSRLPKPVELSNKWILKNLKYQYPVFYSRLFDDSE